MTLTFRSYAVTDDGIALTFEGSGDGAYTIFLTDAELSAIATQAQLRAAVTAKLQRKVNATGIASKLEPLIGQSVSI